MQRDVNRNKIVWQPWQIDYVRDNFLEMPASRIADHVGIGISKVREMAYSMGLKKMRLEYWTPEQVAFLKKYYWRIGDTELAEWFNKKWPREKGWHHHNIEKKRRYLKLDRTPAQKSRIKDRNVRIGRFSECAAKRWATEGVLPEGEMRWRDAPKRKIWEIKVNGKFVAYSRHRWQQLHGAIPPRYRVMYKDGNPHNIADDNLELVHEKEAVMRGAAQCSINLTDEYIAGLITHKKPDLRPLVYNNKKLLEMKRAQLLLIRKLRNYHPPQH